jgi:hypothetical protein
MVPSCWRPDREGVAAANESCDGVGKPSLTKTVDDTARASAAIAPDDGGSGELCT